MAISSLPFKRNESSPRDLRNTNYVFILFMALSLVSLLFHTRSLANISTALLWALACFASGAAAGFLFGIPKILQSADSTSSKAGDESVYNQQVNTNLVEISDWLTKIIVGLGLINLVEIPSFVGRVAHTLAASMGDPKDHLAFSAALIICFFVVGFLFGYLSTRLFLAGAFYRADKGASGILQLTSFVAEADSSLVKEVFSKVTDKEFNEGESSFKEGEDKGDGDEPKEIEEILGSWTRK